MTLQAEYTYDLFVSYAEADRAWVEGYLIDALTQAGVKCHSEAAFALGAPRLLEFERAVKESRRTLLVLSPAYLAAQGFTQFTHLLAQSYGLETATWPVIPFVLHQSNLRRGWLCSPPLTPLMLSPGLRSSSAYVRRCSASYPPPRPNHPAHILAWCPSEPRMFASSMIGARLKSRRYGVADWIVQVHRGKNQVWP